MHIAVDVGAGDPRDGQFQETTHCIIVFVAVDEEGTPIVVSPWVRRSEDETARERYAVRLRELRRSIEDEMQTQHRV